MRQNSANLRDIGRPLFTFRCLHLVARHNFVSCLAEMIRVVVGIYLLEDLPCDAVISADLMFRYAFLRSPGNGRVTLSFLRTLSAIADS
jgi:hypothetical protein